MSGRILFSGAAAAAAGYMIYEYQQQNERQKQGMIPVSSGVHVKEEGRQQQQQSQRLEQQPRDRGLPESIEWVTEKAEAGKNKASGVAETLQKQAAEEGTQLKDETATGWSRISSGISEDVSSIRDALFGRRVQPQQEHQKGTGLSHSIFNWSFNEAERSKAIAIGEYDKANKDLASVQEKWTQTRKGIFDNGDSRLKQQVDVLKKVLNEKKKRLDEASQHYASHARNNFNEMSDGLDAQDEKIRKEGGFFKWLTRSPPEKKKKGHTDPRDEVATSTLVGFGENAYFFSQEQIKDQLRNNEIGPSEAQRRLDELKRIKEQGWLNYAKSPESEESIAKNAYKSLEGWGETAAQLAQEELEEARRRFHRRIESRDDAAKAMDDAAARIQQAKNRVDSTGSSWWQTTKQQSDYDHENAKRAFDHAVHDYDEAKKVFDNWRDKNTGKFWSSADGSVRAMRRQELLPEDSTIQEQLLEE